MQMSKELKDKIFRDKRCKTFLDAINLYGDEFLTNQVDMDPVSFSGRETCEEMLEKFNAINVQLKPIEESLAKGSDMAISYTRYLAETRNNLYRCISTKSGNECNMLERLSKALNMIQGRVFCGI